MHCQRPERGPRFRRPSLRRFALGVLLGAGLAGTAAAATALPDVLEDAFDPEAVETTDWTVRGIIEDADLAVVRNDFEAAADGYREAIALLEDEFGIFDPELIDPVASLGRTYFAMGRYDDALEITGRARHLHRVNYGLHDIGQVEHVELIVQTLLRQGEMESANAYKEYIFELNRRAFGMSVDLVPGLRDLVAWYRTVGQTVLARETLDDAIMLMDAGGRGSTREMVDLLNEYTETLKVDRFPSPDAPPPEPTIALNQGAGLPGQPALPPTATYSPQVNPLVGGRKALERARNIVDGLPDASPRERAETRLRLGDWYLLFEKWGRAYDEYVDAVAILRDSDEGLSSLAEPTPILFPSITPPSRPPEAGVQPRRGVIEVSFDVTERGRVRSVEVLRSVPEGLMDFRTRRVVRAARFRPRFEAGEPVATEGQTFRYEFTYYVQPGGQG